MNANQCDGRAKGRFVPSGTFARCLVCTIDETDQLNCLPVAFFPKFGGEDPFACFFLLREGHGSDVHGSDGLR